jgi:homoserine O-acetyltransferase
VTTVGGSLYSPLTPPAASSARAFSTNPREVAGSKNTVTLSIPESHAGVLGSLTEFSVNWEQWGDPNAPPSKTIVIFPSFSHGSHARSSADDPSPGWWEFMIGPGEYLDTDNYRIICTSFIGSPNSPTSPLSVNPESGSLKHPYGPEFPQITPGDMAFCHHLLLKSLGIDKVHCVVGGSLGGMQVVAFMTLFPEMADRAVIISGTARTSPFSSALRLMQRNAIEADSNYFAGLYNTPAIMSDGPLDGMKAARMMGMMWYRSREEFDKRFEWGYSEGEKPLDALANAAPAVPAAATAPPNSDVANYLEYQAEKFAKSFDPNCYLLLSRAMDQFDVGRSAAKYIPNFEKPDESKEERLERALGRVTSQVQVIGVAQDALIPLSEQEEVYNILKKHQKDVEFIPIDDEHGHDAMFIARSCMKKFAPVISSFIEGSSDKFNEKKEMKERKEKKEVNPDRLGSFTRTIFGNEAAKIIDELPFHLPYDNWLRQIGNTPLLEVEKDLFAKLEGDNPGGSIKDRAITAIVLNKFAKGELQSTGSTLCLVTSGWAGLSLAQIHQALSKQTGFALNVIIVMPLAYAEKEIPAKITALPDLSIFKGGFEEYFEAHDAGKLEEGGLVCVFEDAAFINVLEKTHEIVKNKKWVLMDQHHDACGMDAHASTALELMCQVPALTDVVCATGTGATAAGLAHYLPSHIKVHSRPALSGTVDGLTDVSRYNNFCDVSNLVGYRDDVFSLDDAICHQSELRDEHQVIAGHSTGATFWLAKKIRAENPDSKIVFMAADGTIAEDAFIDTVSTSGGNVNFLQKGSVNNIQQRAMSSRRKRNVPKRGDVMKLRSRNSSSFANLRAPHRRHFSSGPRFIDHLVIGGGPVGTGTASALGEIEYEKDEPASVMLVHDPKNWGAHQDWSRLARLSFDGPEEELTLSRHAVELLDLVDEVRSYQSGAPVVPVRPGMLFLASPGTPMAKACAHAEEHYNDDTFVRRDPKDIDDLYPGNPVTLPPDTLCWSSPVGLCVSPIELCSAQLGNAKAYGVEETQGIASLSITDDGLVKCVVAPSGEEFVTKQAYVFAGAQNREILEKSVAAGHEQLDIPEFEQSYITAISTVRYAHKNHPANPKEGSGHVVTPITLGQLEIPGLIDFQANFSIVAEEYGDVLKTRLSGSIGSEVIPYVADLHTKFGTDSDEKMGEIYQNFFGALFPYLDTEKPLDFNRCVTYRNHGAAFSGTSILEKDITKGDEKTASVLTTVGCFGVGVKFGPALGEAAAAHANGRELYTGMNVFKSGDPSLNDSDLGDKIERAW